jgi:long-subunit fatty acid transport protein
MKKKLIILLLIVMAVSKFSIAQDEKAEHTEANKGFDKSKLFFGGNFGLSFSTYYSLVNVSPQVGYRFNQYLAAGAGVNFIYSSQKYVDFSGRDLYRYNYGVTGLNIFGRVYPIQQVFVQLQPEMNYTWGKVKYYQDNTSQKLSPKLVPSLLAGAGGAIPAGGNGYFIIMIQYDLLQQDRSPYGNHAFFSFGYNVGF